MAGESICNSFNSQSNYHYALKVLYSCSNRDESNRDQFKLVKTTCQGQQACQLDAIREFFGNDECPGTEDAKMTLWLEYSCVGGTDRTTTRAPICDGFEPPSPSGPPSGPSGPSGPPSPFGPPSPSEPPSGPPSGPDGPCEGGKKKHLDVRGCGGWINLDCNGGCLNIRRVG